MLLLAKNELENNLIASASSDDVKMVGHGYFCTFQGNAANSLANLVLLPTTILDG